MRRIEHVHSATTPRTEEGLLFRNNIHLSYGLILPISSAKSLSQLWISVLFCFHPKTYCMPLLLFSQPIIWVWICSIFKFGSVGSQRSPDTTTGKAQCVKISLKIHKTVLLYSLCILRYQRSLRFIVPSQKTLLQIQQQQHVINFMWLSRNIHITKLTEIKVSVKSV